MVDDKDCRGMEEDFLFFFFAFSLSLSFSLYRSRLDRNLHFHQSFVWGYFPKMALDVFFWVFDFISIVFLNCFLLETVGGGATERRNAATTLPCPRPHQFLLHTGATTS